MAEVPSSEQGNCVFDITSHHCSGSANLLLPRSRGGGGGDASENQPTNDSPSSGEPANHRQPYSWRQWPTSGHAPPATLLLKGSLTPGTTGHLGKLLMSKRLHLSESKCTRPCGQGSWASWRPARASSGRLPVSTLGCHGCHLRSRMDCLVGHLTPDCSYLPVHTCEWQTH